MSGERRNPFRASLLIEPLWRRVALGVAAVAVYTLAFVPLYRTAGVGVLALSIFPVVVLGWLFGAWGGLLAGAGSSVLNALLLNAVGEPGWTLVLGETGVEGSALVVVVGAVVGLLRDLGLRLDRHLTEWRKTERALRDSEDRYRMLFQRSRDAIYVSRPDGHIVDVNDAMVDLLGYTRPELLDLDVRTLYEDPAVRDAFEERIRNDGWVKDFPVRLRTKDGSVRDCLITASARFDAGEVVEYQGTIRDVSEDAALVELAERRTKELRDALDELEAFSYSISHDLRTHLVTMGGYASILWREHREQLDEEGQRYLERIVDSGRRMDLFVKDLLELSRVRRSRIRPVAVELSPLLEEVRDALEPAVRRRDARVTLEVGGHAVQADPTLLASALVNLLSNALKFVPPERVPEVEVRAEREGDMVRITVSDNGIGIAPDDVERAFRAFERVAPGSYPGTGVGLAIVQAAVERMGGRVDVSSVPGEGSTFAVVLPAAL